MGGGDGDGRVGPTGGSGRAGPPGGRGGADDGICRVSGTDIVTVGDRILTTPDPLVDGVGGVVVESRGRPRTRG